MRVEKTHIEGCSLLTFSPHVDHRGFFFESFNLETFQAHNLPTNYVQDNMSFSFPNVLRGLHIQTDNPQGKLVRCVSGVIFDVIVDLRPQSKSFKSHLMVRLNDADHNGVYVPPGCAHGFYSCNQSLVYYKCTTLYDKNSDGGIHPLDQELKIKWPHKRYLMSEKDKNLPTMRQWLEKKYG